jgi:hypothetical protein
MCEVVIGNQVGDTIRITQFRRAHPECEDFWDGNWVNCEIEIQAGRFKGAVPACLRTEEFRDWLAGLESVYSTLDGVATYQTLEAWMVIEVRANDLGHVSVQGHVIDAHVDGNRLCFQIATDQIMLKRTIGSVKRFLKRYPVLGQP